MTHWPTTNAFRSGSISMNRNKLKTYAPAARREFIRAMEDRAAFYGLTASKTEPAVVRGDVAVIAGRDHPRAIADKRKKLEARVEKDGFEQTMEAMAYTWFNRFVAIRFMELHGYLDHGYRVLSHPDGKQIPEILEHAEHVELPGLRKDRVIDLKLDGNKDSELYRLLLTAQCNALHKAMPFLFERIDDETELLLPDSLLHSDSLVRKLIDGIDEADWNAVEVIGWLYQFYISEKKDEVIGKIVASADIPAATQLFTPNWIVKYLVQNTLGRQWLATYPESNIRAKMDFYIEPAEQTPETSDQINGLTPKSVDPESLTLLDPACGSCHILVEAYDLFKEIYLDRGYRLKDIPALILQKNLFGLEIDDRAAQLGAFALMMKARADDRRIFDGEVQPNIVCFQESFGLNAAVVAEALKLPSEKSRPGEHQEANNEFEGEVRSIIDCFKDAKTFGSLLRVPSDLLHCKKLEDRLAYIANRGDLVQASALVLQPFVKALRLLTCQFDCVVANPPYMGSKFYPKELKSFIGKNYKSSKADLYSCFIQRNSEFAKCTGMVGMITIPNWMFLSTFLEVRTSLFSKQTISTFIHNGRGVFGSDFGSCSFVYWNVSLPSYKATFRRLFEKQGSVASNDELQQRFATAPNYTPKNADFSRINGSPIAYWVSEKSRSIFETTAGIGSILQSSNGIQTGNNARYVRYWYEVSAPEFRQRWIPYSKGGEFRKWYGNLVHVVDWENNGLAIRAGPNCCIRGEAYYLEQGVTWSDITSAQQSFRFTPPGCLFDAKGPTAFCADEDQLLRALGFLNTPVVNAVTQALNPSVSFQSGDFRRLPYDGKRIDVDNLCLVQEAISIAKDDWDSSEISWDFKTLPILNHRSDGLREAQAAVDMQSHSSFMRMKNIEKANNKAFIEAYGLQDELCSEVSDDQITLKRPNQEENIKRLISYAVGCMMGRFSIEKPGFIFSGSHNQELLFADYGKFQADDDGIMSLCDNDWDVRDDVCNRLTEFLSVVWPLRTLEENLGFIA